MYFFFPTGTDAPIYHWPFATGGMILVNILIFILQVALPEQSEFFLLQFDVINPISWFTSICMHISFGHLLGNMIGLMLFGWIIEGKVGWWRFLLIYFAIGVPASAVEQLIMFLFSPVGCALGASGVVYGLIAIAMIWAPENEVTFAYVFVIFFRPFWGSFQFGILGLGFFAIALEFLTAAFTMFQMSSAVLHLGGAIPGFIIAVAMIKLRQVDCEGYDMLSVWAGTRGERTLTIAQEKKNEEEAEQRKEAKEKLISDGLYKVEQYIDKGHYEMALKRFEMLKRKRHSLKMSEAQLVKIVKGFNKSPDPETKLKSVPVINNYLEQFETYKIPFTLMLARTHLVVESRPRQALRVVKTLHWDQLNPKQQQFTRKLVETAKQQIADGVLEID